MPCRQCSARRPDVQPFCPLTAITTSPSRRQFRKIGGVRPHPRKNFAIATVRGTVYLVMLWGNTNPPSMTHRLDWRRTIRCTPNPVYIQWQGQRTSTMHSQSILTMVSARRNKGVLATRNRGCPSVVQIQTPLHLFVGCCSSEGSIREQLETKYVGWQELFAKNSKENREEPKLECHQKPLLAAHAHTPSADRAPLERTAASASSDGSYRLALVHVDADASPLVWRLAHRPRLASALLFNSNRQLDKSTIAKDGWSWRVSRSCSFVSSQGPDSTTFVAAWGVMHDGDHLDQRNEMLKSQPRSFQDVGQRILCKGETKARARRTAQ
jgi:hypothetical protein